MALNNPENSLIVEFLGDKAALPLGPFTLGGILRAPMVSLFCLREGAGYSIYFKQLSDGEPVPRRQRQQHLQQLAQVYAHELERQCLRQPLQWFNFFDFWHLPQVANQPDPAALPQSQASQIADFPATEKGNI